MTARTILLVSPREPCGATWLINCLLELGVKTFRYSSAGMWRFKDERWHLNDHEFVLKKWLPVLTDRQEFVFRRDVEVRWTHEWPTSASRSHDVVFFVRDPRDAIYSRYRREAPDLSFAEYVDFPDPYSLLNKVEHLRLYCESWLIHPRIHIVRFEDYKEHPDRTLSGVIRWMDINASAENIAQAIEKSSFERAAAAERAYREVNPDDTELINRGGRIQEWRTGIVDEQVVALIESKFGDLLKTFGYPCERTEVEKRDISQHVNLLSLFDSVLLPPVEKTQSHGREYVDLVGETLRFAATLTTDRLIRAKLRTHELMQLRRSLAEYLSGLNCKIDSAFDKTRSADSVHAHWFSPLRHVAIAFRACVRTLFGALAGVKSR